MNNAELIVVLLIGTVLMSVLISVQMKWYRVARWKSAVVSIALILTGAFGSRLWYFVENGYFRGRSLYGAIFLAPVVFFPVARLLRIPYGEILDFCVPSGCLTLALVKIQCLRDGCCGGFTMYLDENHNYVKFPSQLVEMTAFFLIAAFLMMMSYKERNRGRVFPWFLILYGGIRFILNFFRAKQEIYALVLPAGALWSLVAFVVGVVLLSIIEKKGAKKCWD